MCGSKGFSRAATSSDLASVALIHLDAFPGFFLTKLGYKFLHLMYRVFFSNPDGIFVVYESNASQLLGFAVGTLGSGKKDRWLSLYFIPQFIIAVIPATLREPRIVISRLVARFIASGTPCDLPSDGAILRSIGVLSSARGGGAASVLLYSFEQEALRRGGNHVYLTTDQDNNERAKKFYTRMGYNVIKRFNQHKNRPMLLMSKKIDDNVHE